jgi:hypothetical protein
MSDERVIFSLKLIRDKCELEAEIERLHDAAHSCAAVIGGLEAENEQLKAALKDVIDDIHEYERVNNLAPNPPRVECWDSVARARRALERNLPEPRRHQPDQQP